MVAVLILSGAAVLVLVVVLLAALGVVPRNRVAGIRIPAVLASDESWRAGHRAAILPAAVGVLLTAVTGWLSLSVHSLIPYAPAITTAALVLPLIWAAIAANVAAKAAG